MGKEGGGGGKVNDGSRGVRARGDLNTLRDRGLGGCVRRGIGPIECGLLSCESRAICCLLSRQFRGYVSLSGEEAVRVGASHVWRAG